MKVLGNQQIPGQSALDLRGLTDRLLRSPLSGLAPWALMSVLAGPGRFEEAVVAGLVFSLVVLWASWRRGLVVHVLEWFGVGYFAALAVAGVAASVKMIGRLGLWAGELSNITLAVFALVTLLIGRPFTMAYARGTTPPRFRESPLFKRVNLVTSGVWATAFTACAVFGFIGDEVYRNSDNFWTGWILQIAAILAAVAFAEFYPRYAFDKVSPGHGHPSRVSLVDWIPPFVLVTGVAGLVTHSVSDAFGWALIGVGAVGAAVLGLISARARLPK